MVAELIHRRRRQVLVHSILYYRLDASLVPDATFDRWAHELADLQRDHPAASEGVAYMRDAFRGFTGDSGHHLPLTDPRATYLARHLLADTERNPA
ncbi:DNA ligase [Arthrobacter phage CallinAllBarbz]|uniref:DNA ligase n=1 Tax=Arthrobacter phage CallinAllBarbz TaxID=3077790 RepID=A0AA96HDR4_9CAUD|nr:DNA ligase [Arthrobacter phage CallinAllBarbz]